MLDSPKKKPEKKPWNSGLDAVCNKSNSSEEEFDFGILPDIGKKNTYLKI